MSTATISIPTTHTLNAVTEISPRVKARITGALYLISGTAYTYAGGSVRDKLVVSGNAAATAQNILSHTALYWRGFAADVLSTVTYLIVTLLLYDLLKPVNRKLSLSAMIFSLAGCTISGCIILLHLVPIAILQSGSSFTAFRNDQLQALALLSLSLRRLADNICMVFFGCYCIQIGYLIFKSTFLPRIIGFFLIVAGLSYQLYLYPPLAGRVFSYVIMPAGVLGEGSLILWLLVMGVSAKRWNERAGPIFA